jgi:carbon monoxide dehydrogenase subunit G
MPNNSHSNLTVNFGNSTVTITQQTNCAVAKRFSEGTANPRAPGPRLRVRSLGTGYLLPMPSVSRTFSVAPPPSRVIDYLKDFSNAEEWDPGTESCTREGDGPVEVGATWHNVSKIVGVTAELTYRLDSLSNRTLVFVGTNDSSKSVDTITVDASGAGSVITYQADLEMKGAAKLLSPAMKLVFEKLANDTEKQMTTVLNGLL